MVPVLPLRDIPSPQVPLPQVPLSGVNLKEIQLFHHFITHTANTMIFEACFWNSKVVPLALQVRLPPYAKLMEWNAARLTRTSRNLSCTLFSPWLPLISGTYSHT